MRERYREILGDDNALPGRERVILNDVRAPRTP